MRFIKKAVSPTFFEAWKDNYRNDEGINPEYRNLVGSPKRELKQYLIDEQKGLCCYCCKKISRDNSHIEHIKPKGIPEFKSQDLDYNNLAASCNGLKDNRENCGHRKNNWYDSKTFISPTDENCEMMFKYTINGEMSAADGEEWAEETIDKLQLKSNLLIRARRAAIDTSGIFDEDYDIDKKQRLIEFYNDEAKPELEAFCNAIVYCLENY
jgi:uncharacterized protein (TIGR02646 family)